MTRDDVVAVLARRFDSFASRDWAGLGTVYAPQARVESPLVGCVEGPDAIVRATQAFALAFPDALVTEKTTVIEGHQAIIIAETSGTHTGGFMGLAPSGRPFRFLGAFVFEFDGGLIVSERRIYDFTGLLVQIGVLKAKPA